MKPDSHPYVSSPISMTSQYPNILSEDNDKPGPNFTSIFHEYNDVLEYGQSMWKTGRNLNVKPVINLVDIDNTNTNDESRTNNGAQTSSNSSVESSESYSTNKVAYVHNSKDFRGAVPIFAAPDGQFMCDWDYKYKQNKL